MRSAIACFGPESDSLPRCTSPATRRPCDEARNTEARLKVRYWDTAHIGLGHSRDCKRTRLQSSLCRWRGIHPHIPESGASVRCEILDERPELKAQRTGTP